MEKDIFDCLNESVWLHGGADDHPDVLARLQECADACHEINSLLPSMVDQRTALFRKLLGSLGSRFVINSPFRCDFGFNIHIGENFIGNFNLTILDEAHVEIGDNVMIGPNCTLTTITHAIDAEQRNAGIMKASPIKIGNNVWIASNVVILPGVTIGDNSVIGAGSLVCKSIPSGVLAVGTPCRPLRRITKEDKVDI